VNPCDDDFLFGMGPRETWQLQAIQALKELSRGQVGMMEAYLLLSTLTSTSYVLCLIHFLISKKQFSGNLFEPFKF
jgi:hypothetical protein